MQEKILKTSLSLAGILFLILAFLPAAKQAKASSTLTTTIGASGFNYDQGNPAYNGQQVSLAGLCSASSIDSSFYSSLPFDFTIGTDTWHTIADPDGTDIDLYLGNTDNSGNYHPQSVGTYDMNIPCSDSSNDDYFITVNGLSGSYSSALSRACVGTADSGYLFTGATTQVTYDVGSNNNGLNFQFNETGSYAPRTLEDLEIREYDQSCNLVATDTIFNTYTGHPSPWDMTAGGSNSYNVLFGLTSGSGFFVNSDGSYNYFAQTIGETPGYSYALYGMIDGGASYFNTGDYALAAQPIIPIDSTGINVGIYAPAYGVSTTDFKDWEVNTNIPADSSNESYGLGTDPITGYSVAILYNDLTNPGAPILDDQLDSDNPGSIYTIPPDTRIKDQLTFINKQAALNVGDTYSATATLFDQNHHIITTSSTIEFTVIAGGTTTYPVGPTDYSGQNGNNAPIACATKDTSLIGTAYTSACQLLYYLFVPTQGAIIGATAPLDDITLIKTKVPFAYFYDLESSFEGTETTPTNGYFINTTLAASGGTSGTAVSLPFAFFNTADSSIHGIFQSYQPWIEAGLWLWFAWYAFTRMFRIFVPE